MLLAVRLVLDTSVIVAAFRSHNGASNLLLRFVDRGMVTPLCSTALFLEYEAVLSRGETRKATGHSLEDVAAVMNALGDALSGVLGLEAATGLQMPATPHRVWQALRGARAGT